MTRIVVVDIGGTSIKIGALVDGAAAEAACQIATASLRSAEIVVVVCGLWMLPRGEVDGRVFRSFFLAALSGLAMGAVAWALRGFHGLLVAPVSLLAYAAALRLTGAIDQTQVAALKGFFERKLGGLRRRILRST